MILYPSLSDFYEFNIVVIFDMTACKRKAYFNSN